MFGPRIYAASSVNEPLRQGEILSNVVRLRLDVVSQSEFPGPQDVLFTLDSHPLVVVISQDCDLDWDFKARSENKPGKLLPDILVCEVNLATEIRGMPEIVSKIWERIKINKDERYQFLEKVPGDCDAQQIGLQEMALDFKRCFSIPTAELYLQLKTQAKRRCRLVSPYVEHLSHRIFSFHSRVGLPSDHTSEPEAK